jgi:hypothetical protein
VRLTVAIRDASDVYQLNRVEYDGDNVHDLLGEALGSMKSRQRILWIHLDRDLPEPAPEPEVTADIAATHAADAAVIDDTNPPRRSRPTRARRQQARSSASVRIPEQRADSDAPRRVVRHHD